MAGIQLEVWAAERFVCGPGRTEVGLRRVVGGWAGGLTGFLVGAFLRAVVTCGVAVGAHGMGTRGLARLVLTMGVSVRLGL